MYKFEKKRYVTIFSQKNYLIGNRTLSASTFDDLNRKSSNISHPQSDQIVEATMVTHICENFEEIWNDRTDIILKRYDQARQVLNFWTLDTKIHYKLLGYL